MLLKLSGSQEMFSTPETIFRDFEQGQHQDAHEFLRCLLDKLDEVTVAPRSESEEPSSIVKELFGGQLKSQLNCPKCNHCSDRLESFLDLNLEVNQMDTIMDSLSSYTKIEVVEDFICDGCKSRVNMEKHLKVEQAPEVLVIQLKRFQNLGSDISKIHDMVKYQLELDLNPFMSSPVDKPQCYDLYGVVEHWGNTAKGHYVCYIRSSETDWFLFDDDKIVKMTEDRVLEKKAYVLFYVKKGSSPWFSTLLEKEMLLSDYFEELAGKGLDEDGASKAGSYSSSGSDSDNGSVEQDVTEHFSGPAEKNEAGPSSAGLSQGVQGIENGSTLCSVPDKNEVGCSLGGVPSGGTQKPTSLILSSVENGDASGLPLLLENKEKSSHGTREANHNGPSSEVLDAGSHGGSSQENGRSCNLPQSSSHKHEDCCPENLTLHKEEEDGMVGSCDSPAGSLHARGSAGTSRLRTMSESRPEQGSG
ncbi:ubiquitin carboxyl-terminal hydrolase 18-like [Triticum dicoccoides]|uniref:ubiquitin carboxyl-terminal hydrolase 18-like n=1 Tax=Triticum dicoccoides TaxID=85692 RepID=UPI00188EBD24|nr:ubiquitin carboxyl-terminal hydrolase 18-like [Triticum dicoccoides]